MVKRRRHQSNQSGFTLIELMVSVVILALAAVGIVQAFSTGFQGTADARDITEATTYAQEKMEEITNTTFDGIVSETSAIPQTKFTCNVSVENPYSGDTDLKKVTTTVSWLNRNGESKSVELISIIYNW
jgi:prepilin-type N-terminal cleavage/methylation domain-containing protein